MKSFMKTCSIIALFLLGAGVAFFIAGCALGGADQVSSVVNDVTGGKVNFNVGESGDWDFNIGGVSSDDVKNAIAGIMDNKIYNIDDFGSIYDSSQKIHDGDVDKFDIPSDGIEDLKMDIGACELTILSSDDENFWVEAKNVQKLQAFADGDTLRIINTSKEKKITGLDIRKTKIYLYVPSDFVFEKAEIELGAGIIQGDAFAAKKAEIKIGAGDFEVKNIDSDDVKIEVGAGNIDLDDVSIGKLECKVGAGNASVEGTLHDDVKVECALGNVNLELKNNYNDFDYKVQCAAGNVNLNGKQYSGLSKEEKIDNDAKNDMKLECSMGNINVSFK